VRCELCGHVFGQKHRVLPGEWGGGYEESNVVYLCPNHHWAIHVLMNWRYRNHPAFTKSEDDQIDEYRLDPDLMKLWEERAQPVVIRQMVAEGRWEEGALPMAVFAGMPSDLRELLAN
jgi:hypothetical protein